MRAFLMPAAFAATLVTATSAFALNGPSDAPAPDIVQPKMVIVPAPKIAPRHAMHTTGYVKAYNGKSERLTLTNGERFAFPRTFAKLTLNSGEKVTVAWRLHDGHRIANRVTMMS